MPQRNEARIRKHPGALAGIALARDPPAQAGCSQEQTLRSTSLPKEPAELRDDRFRRLLRQEVATWEGLTLEDRLCLRPPGAEHVPESSHSPFRSPEREERRLDLAARRIVRAIVIEIDPRGGAIVLARGADCSLAAIAADVFRHRFGCDGARRLTLHRQMFAQVVARSSPIRCSGLGAGWI